LRAGLGDTGRWRTATVVRHDGQIVRQHPEYQAGIDWWIRAYIRNDSRDMPEVAQGLLHHALHHHAIAVNQQLCLLTHHQLGICAFLDTHYTSGRNGMGPAVYDHPEDA
jgi:hypothetical protein